MKCSIEYGIYIDSQTMKYVSFSLSLLLCLSLSSFFTLSSHLLFTDHSPLLSAGEKSH